MNSSPSMRRRKKREEEEVEEEEGGEMEGAGRGRGRRKNLEYNSKRSCHFSFPPNSMVSFCPGSKMTQWVRTLAVKPGNQDFIPRENCLLTVVL